MKVKEMYPDRWLKAEHLAGKTHLVTIEEVTVEPLFNPTTKKSEKKFVVRFYRKQLRMILNKTQCLALARITGEDDSDGWKGHQILIGPATAPNGAGTILISRPPDAPATPPATPPTPDPPAQTDTEDATAAEN